MMSKREEIEKDVEGTKAKMLEEKLNSGNINYWYENEYDYPLNLRYGIISKTND